LIIVIFQYGRRSLPICFALCVASFVLAELMLTTHRSTAFYPLPSRIWELLLGSCIALGMRAGRAFRLKPVSANRAALRFRRTGRQTGCRLLLRAQALAR
jgi:peptidoglycan/LPS O-acetylase OafA/YrhL